MWPEPRVKTERAPLPRNGPLPEDAYSGRWWIILSRYAACPFCSLRIDRIERRAYELTNAGVKLLVVFPSPPERIEKYYPAASTPFTVISDTSETLYDLLGSKTSVMGTLRTAVDIPVVLQAELAYMRNPLAIDGPFTRLPADYLVRDGTIERSCVGRRLDDGLDMDDVLRWAMGC